ncbi:type II toxin-antitoxin system VapC family toxin [Sphingomonas profundi]|uniref:type II toxin-antitoxin system VapC family toxin n=1 Tax=Alterirhizorhabdus profundi TaxID=2681549 RepID=UPI0012E82BC1|nr:type II toxin-antitoxin system VapC family toxin [Sphingomonas profundi]
MSYLLDTHALIWWWLGDPALSIAARDLMVDRANRIFVSPVTAVEIAIKVRSGKLAGMSEPLAAFGEGLAADGFRTLDIRYDHARRAGLMAGEHRDPFDRLLAAQALTEGLTIITRDTAIARFGCEVIW